MGERNLCIRPNVAAFHPIPKGSQSIAVGRASATPPVVENERWSGIPEGCQSVRLIELVKPDPQSESGGVEYP